MRLTCLAFACLSTAAALLPTSSPFRAQVAVKRSARLIAQQEYVQNLPAGWTTGFDQANGHIYYVNQQTGQSQWEMPQGDPTHSGLRQNERDLPAGWTMGFDQSCAAFYYYNEQTGQSQWEPPQQGGYQQQEPAEQLVSKVAAATQQGVTCTMRSATGWGPRYAGKYTLRNGDEEILGRYDMDVRLPLGVRTSRFVLAHL